MITARRIIAACIAVVLLGTGGWLLFFHVRHTDVPLANQTMVLHLKWSPETRAALQAHAAQFQGITVLACQIFPNGAVERSDADYALLGRLHVPVELEVALMEPMDVTAGSPQQRSIASAIVDALRTARTAGVNPTDILLDPQDAQAPIDQFSNAIAAAQDAGHLPVCFTAARDWVYEPQFKSLAKSAGSFILRENSPNAARTALGDPVEIAKDVEWTAGFRIPFRVELPTYAANYSSVPPVVLRPDPADTIALLNTWKKSHPLMLTGIVWHHLPQEDDTTSWRWVTLNSVLHGTLPHADVHLELRHIDPSDPNLTEISLVNQGSADARIDQDYLVQWDTTADMEQYDSLPGYTVQNAGRYKLIFWHHPEILNDQRISPGDRRVIGTVKLTDDTPLRVSPPQ